jgi:PPM family protein phosphatase
LRSSAPGPPPSEGSLLPIEVHGATDQGLVRDENQDSFDIIHGAGAGPGGAGGVLLVVADGMGGLAAGGTASRIVVETLGEAYRTQGGPDPRATLQDAVREANRKIHALSGELPVPAPMGSTVTAAAMAGRSAWILHVGDSRAYRVPPAGAMVRLTQDHSWVEELARRGELSQGSLLFSLHRNVLTRGVGLRPEVEVDVVEIHDLAPGDLLLISSDGLHGLVGDAEIESRARSRGADLPGLAADLIKAARDRGGPDNITLVAARIAGSPPAPPGEPGAVTALEPKLDRRPSTITLVLCLLAAFALAVGAIFLLQSLSKDDDPPAQEDLLEGVLKQVKGASTPGPDAAPEVKMR